MEKLIMQEAFDSEGFCFTKEKKIKHIVIGALPGEEVTCQFVGRKHKETYSLLTEVIKKNPHRVDAPCEDIPRCGGCVFQNFDYQKQLEHKENKVRSLFEEDSGKLEPILASPEIFAYRAKMDFSFSQNKAGEKFLGLIQAKGQGRVMMTKSCHLAQNWMNQALKIVQQAFVNSELKAFDRRGEGDLRSLILREGINTKQKMMILEVAAHEHSALKKDQLKSFFDPIKELDPNISCYLKIVQQIPGVPTQIYEMPISGPLCIHETINIQERLYTFKISPSAFFQPNPKTAEILFNTLVKIVKPLNVKRACDLFCGTGTIGLALSPYFESCIGVELNPYAVFDAKENAELNKITNIEFLQQDAVVFIKENKEKFDLVIVDPPRAGLGLKSCQLLEKFDAKHILYVSCNPVTQALDVQELKLAGYEILLIQPLDQFPHTNHVENIILLKKI